MRRVGVPPSKTKGRGGDRAGVRRPFALVACPEMGTDKNAARYQDMDKRDSESALSPPFDLVRPVFDVTDVWPVCCRLPWNFGGLPTMPIGFAGIGSQ